MLRWLLPFIAGAALAIAGMFALGLVPTSENPALAETVHLEQVIVDQRAEIARLGTALRAQTSTISHLQTLTAKAASTPSPTPAKPMAALADMMNTPAMRKMMAAQQTQFIESEYADLIAKFHFTPEERAQFIHLLAARQQLDTDAGFKTLKADPVERKALAAELREANRKADGDIREFFNNDADFATFNAYKDQQLQRFEMKALKPGLKAIEQPLSPAQETALLAAMQSERKAFKFTSAPDEDALSPAATERQLADTADLDQKIAARAATILSPQQLAVFQSNQARQLQMTKAGMELSRTMLGN